MKTKVIKSSILLALCFVITSVNAQDLYLIIGQSNASGRDTNFDPNGLDSQTSQVKYFTDNNSFINAEQPLNSHSGIRKSLSLQGVNLGLEFGKKMYDYNGNDIYLVVNARGATKVAQWREGKSTGYFSNTVQRVKDAELACNCTLKGILWHQGEGNIKSDGSYTSSYFSSLKLLIQEFRDELGDTPFLIGQLHHENKNDNFNDDIKDVDDSNFGVSNVDWVTAKNLTTFDGTHFDASSTRLLGRRYAKIMKDYVSSSGSSARTLASQENLISADEIAEKALKLFPNPANKMLHVLGEDEVELFEIYNFQGSKVIETKTKDIDISSLNPGIYLIVIGKNERYRFIKK